MPRVLLLATLAGALLGAVSVLLIWLATGGAHAPAALGGSAEAASASPAPAPAGGAMTPPWSPPAARATAPPDPALPPAEAVGSPSRHPAPASAGAPRRRAERRLLRAQQVRNSVGARRDGGPGAEAAPGRGLPPEERAAMEAAGIDWRRLERMVEGGTPDEEGR